MKKLLIMSIALVAIMATVFTVSAFAANTVTIGENITVAKYYDAEGNFNDAYAVVTVPYTVTGDVDRLTFYLAAQDLSAALEGEEAKVVYIDETVNPAAESFTFVIEKARVKSAANATAAEGTSYTNATIENFVLTFKLGGTDVDTADSRTVTYVNPTYYGDVNADKELSTKDTLAIKRFGVGTMELSNEQKVVGDVNGDGELSTKDTLFILRIGVGTKTYNDVLTDRTWAY